MASTTTRDLAHPIISSEDVEGVEVYDGHGRKLGTVDHMMIEKVSGRVVSVVLKVKGFFGLGHSHAELPWSALKYNTRLNAFEAETTPQSQ